MLEKNSWFERLKTDHSTLLVFLQIGHQKNIRQYRKLICFYENWSHIQQLESLLEVLMKTSDHEMCRHKARGSTKGQELPTLLLNQASIFLPAKFSLHET